MTDITYGHAPQEAARRGGPKEKRKGFWRIVYEALIEARRLQGEMIAKDYLRRKL